MVSVQVVNVQQGQVVSVMRQVVSAQGQVASILGQVDSNSGTWSVFREKC